MPPISPGSSGHKPCSSAHSMRAAIEVEGGFDCKSFVFCSVFRNVLPRIASSMALGLKISSKMKPSLLRGKLLRKLV